MKLLSLGLASLAALMIVAGPAGAAEKAALRTATLSEGNLTVEVRDLSPRFLAFYDAARDVRDPDARFKLWDELYGFAAVPPTPEGQAMARQLLDGAWPRYGEALDPARAGAAGMQPPPLPILHRVAEILGLAGPARMQLITYVGGFEGNAFTFRGEVPVLAIPLESPPAERALFLAHEGTHAVHMLVANLSGGWERSVAATMLQEGLAMHVSREVVPGRPFEDYVSHRPGWWAQSQAQDRAILEDLRSKLARSDSAAVTSVTIARGAAGVEREAYYGGWRVVDALRRQGMTLAQIARIPEAEMPERVGRVLDELLAAPPA